MLYYKNNYHQSVDCWVNGIYQGVIPAKSTKYMPREGFVTADSGWQKDGTLKHTHAYGGWSPSSPARVVTVAISGLGQPVVMWDASFTANENGSNLKIFNLGDAIDRYDMENAEGMFKGDPKDLAKLLGDKQFSPKTDWDGASSEGENYAAKIETKLKLKKVANKITLEVPKVRNSFIGGLFSVSKSKNDLGVYEVKLFVDGIEVDKKVLDREDTIDAPNFYGVISIAGSGKNYRLWRDGLFWGREPITEAASLKVFISKIDTSNSVSEIKILSNYQKTLPLENIWYKTYQVSLANENIQEDSLSNDLDDSGNSERYELNLKGNSIEINFNLK